MLRRLEDREINQVLAENFDIWSPGLDRSTYRHYQWWQMHSAWGRRNLHYLGLLSTDGKILASCKLYNFLFCSRGREYKMAGVGAVFVADANRGKGYAGQMMNELISFCTSNGFDGMVLNSDIAPEFYERFGFELCDYSSFSIKLSADWLRESIRKLDSLSDRGLDEVFNVRSLKSEDMGEMCRHHRRWLRRQPYGMARDEDYWSYKTGRESFLFQHSRLNWPKLSIIADNYGMFESGYALVEQSGPYLRVLEVIGRPEIFHSIWSEILRLATRHNATFVRGWNVMAPPLPGFTHVERDWSFPMIRALKPEYDELMFKWTEQYPAMFLELDHF